MEALRLLWKRLRAAVEHFLLQCYMILALNFYEPIERVFIGQYVINKNTTVQTRASGVAALISRSQSIVGKPVEHFALSLLYSTVTSAATW